MELIYALFLLSLDMKVSCGQDLYLISSEQAVNFDNAKTKCQESDRELATFKTVKELGVIQEKILREDRGQLKPAGWRCG